MFHFPYPITDSAGEPNSIKVRQSKDHTYNILQYLSNEKKFTLVTDLKKETAFAYMPPRPDSLNEGVGEIFDTGASNETDCEFDVRDAIEGTMITFFWNGDAWEICTRNGVGCNYSFIKREDPAPRTFREMVLDVFSIRRYIETDMSEPMPVAINDLTDLHELDALSKEYCYTCILQHVDNHIVYSTGMSLNLIAIYELFAMPPLVPADSNIRYAGTIREVFNPDEYPQMNEMHFPDSDREVWAAAKTVFKNTSSIIRILNGTDEVIAFHSKILKKFEKYIIFGEEIGETPNSIYYPPAWIITNKRTGQRFEIANPPYELAKSLRNMQPNMMFQYLLLKQQGLVDKYLNAFPRYNKDFRGLNDKYEGFVAKVYAAYVTYYIKKERGEVIPKNHFVHAARIHHAIYLSPENLRRKITRETVENYFAKISPSKMFYYLTAHETS